MVRNFRVAPDLSVTEAELVLSIRALIVEISNAALAKRERTGAARSSGRPLRQAVDLPERRLQREFENLGTQSV